MNIYKIYTNYILSKIKSESKVEEIFKIILKILQILIQKIIILENEEKI